MKYITIFFLIITLGISKQTYADATKQNVYYAGFAFSGNYSDRGQTGKYTEEILNYKAENGLDVISNSLIKSIKNTNGKNFNISFDMPDLDKGDFESIVMSVVLDYEYFSSELEPITSTYLNNIDMYFQILFYNFKSRKLIAAIPFDVEINTYSKHRFTNNDVIDMIRKFYVQGLKTDDDRTINAFNQVENILNSFTLKDKYKFHIGVTDVVIEDRAKNEMSQNILNNINSFKNQLAQSFSSRLSLHQNIALVPFQEGEAIGGKMKQRFVNSDEVYNIELPVPDFNIELRLRGYRKQLVETSDVSNIYLYGAYANIKIQQPDIKKVYMNHKFKNGSQIKIPTNIQNVNDWRKFYGSTVKLFDDFAINITKKDNRWIKFQKTKTQSSNDVSMSLDNVQGVLKKVR